MLELVHVHQSIKFHHYAVTHPPCCWTLLELVHVHQFTKFYRYRIHQNQAKSELDFDGYSRCLMGDLYCCTNISLVTFLYKERLNLFHELSSCRPHMPCPPIVLILALVPIKNDPKDILIF